MRIQFQNVFCWIMQEILEMQPEKVSREQLIYIYNYFTNLTSWYPVPERAMSLLVGHACFTAIASCTNDITVHASYEGLGTNVWCCSTSALCQTRDNNGKSLPTSTRESCDRLNQSPLSTPGNNGETRPKKQTRKTAYWSTIQAVAKLWMMSH